MATWRVKYDAAGALKVGKFQKILRTFIFFGLVSIDLKHKSNGLSNPVIIVYNADNRRKL